jgi:HSP20 family protein
MNSLVTYRPVRGLDVFGNFDRMLDAFFDDTPVWNARTPAVDVKEEADRYVLEAELPGLSEKDVEVKVEENLLTIVSAKNEEKEENKNGYLMKERRSSSFQRSFVLPKDADKDNIHAKFKNGLLILDLHKKPEVKPRSIEVKVE